MAPIRLDKYLTVALGISRTEAKLLIRSGNVTVEDAVARKGDQRIDTENRVELRGERLVYKEHIYVLMNKPEGILSASTDKRVKTVVDILPENLKRDGLFPVGRLDKNTTGLLIITDDGDFGHKVMSPKTHIEKCYRAELDGPLREEYKKVFSEGVTLADGEECLPAELIFVDTATALVKVCEGKYHQIKRMFGVVGLGVNKLHRESIGKLTLPEDLPKGEVRELTEEEITKIFL